MWVRVRDGTAAPGARFDPGAGDGFRWLGGRARAGAWLRAAAVAGRWIARCGGHGPGVSGDRLRPAVSGSSGQVWQDWPGFYAPDTQLLHSPHLSGCDGVAVSRCDPFRSRRFAVAAAALMGCSARQTSPRPRSPRLRTPRSNGPAGLAVRVTGAGLPPRCCTRLSRRSVVSMGRADAWRCCVARCCLAGMAPGFQLLCGFVPALGLPGLRRSVRGRNLRLDRAGLPTALVVALPQRSGGGWD